jgi:threonine 3-dehydrogenase
MLAFGVGTLPNLLALGTLARRGRGLLDATVLRCVAAAILIAFGLLGLWRVDFADGAVTPGPFCVGPWQFSAGRSHGVSLMKALQKTGPAFGLELRDVAEPESPARDQVIVEVSATGLCGTDVHIYEWTAGYEAMTKAMPVTLGHEFSGVIAAAGPGVHGLAIGALVAVRPSVVCGHCAACVAGNAEACTNRSGIGVTRDGGLAKLVSVPAENCIVVPEGMDAHVVALTEPMTVSAEAVTTGEVRKGDRVLVLGPGNIGQGVALFAREAGAAQVVIAGKDDALRLGVLRRMGFPHTVDLGERTLVGALAAYLTAGKFDVVIEATGSPEVAQQGLDVLRKRGILVVCGIHPKPASVNLTRLVRDHQQIRGSYRAPVAAWSRVISFLSTHAELVGHMISHRVPLERALDGFELARKKAASKVLIVP